MTAYISIFITIVLFSSIESFSKMLTGSVDPFLIAFIRFFLSGFLLILLDIKKIKILEKKDIGALFILGLVGITIALGAFHTGITGLNASTAAVIFSMNPIFSSLFAIIFLKESFTKNKIIGTIISFAGVYIVIFGFKILEFTNIRYVILMFISAIGFGSYISGAKPYIQKYGTMFTTGIIFLSGSIPYLFFIKNYQIENLSNSFPILLYLSIITTGLAYVLYFYGLKRVPIIVGTSMFYLKPVIATIFAIFLLNEIPEKHFYIGVIIILSGMFITIRKL